MAGAEDRFVPPAGLTSGFLLALESSGRGGLRMAVCWVNRNEKLSSRVPSPLPRTSSNTKIGLFSPSFSRGLQMASIESPQKPYVGGLATGQGLPQDHPVNFESRFLQGFSVNNAQIRSHCCDMPKESWRERQYLFYMPFPFASENNYF